MNNFKSFRLPAILICFSVMLTQKICSQQIGVPDSLRVVLDAKEKEMFAAITSGNEQAAAKLMSADYITINADGVMEGRENTLKTIGKFKGSTGTLSDKKYRVYGNVAIINGRAKFYLKKILVAEIFYTEIWEQAAGEWQFNSWQGTMTGLPAYYPIIVTILAMFLLYAVVRFFVKKKRSLK